MRMIEKVVFSRYPNDQCIMLLFDIETETYSTMARFRVNDYTLKHVIQFSLIEDWS